MKLKEKFLRIFGDIKILPYPPFLYYQKGCYYKVSGEETRNALSTLERGDIVCRGYDDYLDGYFIPGDYTHSGIYIGNGKIIHAVAEGVSEIDVMDFLRCDRYIICRPNRGYDLAVLRAKEWLGTPYDFDFTAGDEALYCHELSASAYIELDIKKVIPYLGFIKFKRMEPKYLAESFIKSPDFTIVREFNKRRKK